MSDWLVNAYPWIKAAHVVAVISWMAGLLYLPRLFVYHAGAAAEGELAETLSVMERRLLRLIMNPAMVLAWVFGGLMAATPGLIDWSAAWVWGKAGLVVAMTAYHHALALWRKDFAHGRNRRTARFYRIANEVPTVLMIAIVVLVIVQPS